MTRFVFPLCVLLLWARPVDAQQTKYYLPVLPGSEGMDLGLALTNLGASEVTVTLTARDYSGSIVLGAGITNPATIRIRPSAQRALRTTEIFGAGMAGRTGWAEVLADASVKGFYLLFDSKISFIDGSNLPSAASKRLIFQRVTANSTTSSAISFINITGQRLTGVTLSLYEGVRFTAPMAQKVFDIDPYSGFSGPVTDLIPTATKFEGYAVVELPADTSVDALVGVGTYKIASDIAVLNPATDASRQRGGYLPHLATGLGYTTRFYLINHSSVSQTVRVTAQGLDQPGHGFPPGLGSIEKTINPYGIFGGDVSSIFGMVAPALITGYLRWEVPQATPGLIGYLDYGTSDGVLLSAAPAQTSTDTDLVFSHIAEGSGYYTGLAFLNLNDVAAGVTISAFDSEGNLRDTASFQLQSGERRSRLLREMLPAVDVQLSGYVRLTSTQPIVAFQLFGSSDALRFLANVPAQSVGRSSPAPQPANSNPPAALMRVGTISRIGVLMFTARVVDANGNPLAGIIVGCAQTSGPGAPRFSEVRVNAHW
jgi:hypothetical protein